MTCERRAGLLALALLASPAYAGGGAFPGSPHGDPATGVLRLAGITRGECAHCHDMHASRDGVATAGPFPWLLFTVNDNALCSEAGGLGGCHAVAGDDLIYPGILTYEQSIHATSGAMVWPGPDPPARSPTDSGFCVNCHDPHATTDGIGTIPSMTFQREEALCLECHDLSGPAGSDIQADFQRLNRHPAPDITGAHVEGEGNDPTAFADGNRHAECVDCHNPHRAREDILAPTPPQASNALLGVSRIAVTNGPAGLPPAYTYRGPDDPSPVNEYELCFKCHSSWTTQPPGQDDMALLFNLNNPSTHAVEGPGADPTIDPGSFVAGHGPTDILYCADCHTSGLGAPAGPHGSDNPFLLTGPYQQSTATRVMTSDEVCFQCHRYDVYADDSSADSVKALSRWNPPAYSAGHTKHVTQRDRSCYSCHNSHGSPDGPKLFAFGRVEGLDDWTGTATDGTCFPNCHRDRTYDVNYPR